MKRDWKFWQDLALAEVAATLAALPQPLQERAREVPVILERVPGAALQAEGIESDSLGLFNGPEFADAPDVLMPPQILLFLENLRDYAEGDPDIFREEVHTTLLHELGHYLGLDEDGLADRGLE